MSTTCPRTDRIRPDRHLETQLNAGCQETQDRAAAAPAEERQAYSAGVHRPLEMAAKAWRVPNKPES